MNIKIKKIKWTKDIFVQEILRISKDGIAPASHKYNSLRGAASRLFGSWGLALKYAGLEYFKNRPSNKCLVEGCNNKERNRGSEYCEKHYYQKRRIGYVGTKIDMVKNENCIYCGSKLRGEKRKFCSERCSTRFYRKNDRFKKCVTCGLMFEPIDKGIDRITCSPKCHDTYMASERLKKSISPVLFDSYAEKLKWCNYVKSGDGDILITKCVYCGKEFPPTLAQVGMRLQAVNGKIQGEMNMYCSDICKRACPTYRAHKYYKGKKIGGTREVPAEFRHMALADRNYTCERCGKTEGGLHVHHIDGYTEQPMFSVDLVNVLVLCPYCHKQIHKKTGCTYVDYRCNNNAAA